MDKQRIIKFRGKRKDNGQWVYGSLVNNLWVKSEHADNPGEKICHIVRGECINGFEDLDNDEECGCEVTTETVGQFTGILDNAGKDVYEGDIVQAYRSGRKDLKFEIKYADRSFVMWQEGDRSEMDCIWFYEFGVIGNIYDNPELLNK